MSGDPKLLEEIAREIEEHERHAQFARKAIGKHMRRHKKMLAEAMAALDAAERTREQHLDRRNRLIADLMMLRSEIQGEGSEKP